MKPWHAVLCWLMDQSNNVRWLQVVEWLAVHTTDKDY